MLHRRASASDRRKVAKVDATADPLSLPVERGNRVGQFPHHDRAASRRCSYFPTLVGPEKIDKSRYWRHVAVVDQNAPTYSEPRRDMPPVEDRIRKSVGSVDENEIERSMRKRDEHLMRRADSEAKVRCRDVPSFAFREDPFPLAFVRCDHLMIRAGGSKDDRARAGSGLERVEPGLELPFEPVERLPLEPPACIASGVQPGWRPAKVSRYPLDPSSLTAPPEATHLTESSERPLSPSCCPHSRL
jgi:hypothetical protein